MSNTSDWSLNPHFPCCRVLPTQTPMLGAQRYQKFSLSLSVYIWNVLTKNPPPHPPTPHPPKKKKINKNQEECVTLVLSPVCNASSKADTVE